MSNRNYASQGKIYVMHGKPVLLDCSFVVDSTNGNGLGIRSLKGPGIQNVFMHTSATPGIGNSNPNSLNIAVLNPNPEGPTGGGIAPGSPSLLTSAPFAILAYAAITGSAGSGSTITGNMGITPNNLTSITNFPPSTDIGTIHAADSVALQAMIDATAAYTYMQAQPATTIATELGGQSLAPGVYHAASGTFQITGGTTLTLTGGPNDVYIFRTDSTLITGIGAGGQPVINLGSVKAANVYWAVGSSATINSAVSSAGATFHGTIIAQVSITATQAGTIDGRLFALTGAVTLSDTNVVTLPTGGVPIGGGVIVVQFEDNFNRAISGLRAMISPVSGLALKVDNSALTAGTPYIITTLGNSTLAQWQALGVPKGVTPAVGVSFIAASVGAGANTSTSRVMIASGLGSGIASIETVGDPNLCLAPDASKYQGFGGQIILQCRDYSMAKAAPLDGTVINLSFLLNDSGVVLQGE